MIIKRIKLKRDAKITEKLAKASGSARNLADAKIKVIEKMNLSVSDALKNKLPLPVFSNLIPIISNLEVLMAAYGNINTNTGSMTPGTLKQTADGSSLLRLQAISDQLKTGKFAFPAVRRTYLPKPGKPLKFWKIEGNLVKFGRPLGMPDFDSKVVQESLKLVLTAIYEPIFEVTNSNYGFRPRKGCQDAIDSIRPQSQGMDIAIEGDIKAAFPTLNHEILVSILRKRIRDEKFLNVVNQACKAGIFDEMTNSYHDPIIGVPQGGIVSPLLWNIYMNEFDDFVHNDLGELFAALNKRQKRQTKNVAMNHPKYRAILYKKSTVINKYRKLTVDSFTKIKELNPIDKALAISYTKEIKMATVRLLNTPSKDKSNVRLRFFFIRYADDWMFFLNGKNSLATLVKNKIASFLKYSLGLTLSLEKTKITHLRKTTAKFLGFTLKLLPNKLVHTKAGTLKRVGGQKVHIGIDHERVKNRLLWGGFLDYKSKPREKPAWSTLTDYEIVTRYNSIIQGTVNYYAPMIEARSSLNYYVYIYQYSCYKTLCQRHRTTIRKLLKSGPLEVKAPTFNERTPSGDLSQKKGKTVKLLTSKTYWDVLGPIPSKLQNQK